MSSEIKSSALKGGVWLAGLTSVSQVISWVATITVANLLNPEDYGLMSMAGIFTAYIEYISDMGIGASVIQKKEINKKELSSLFWLATTIGLFFAIIALCLAYPTSLVFNEKRVVPITCLISINFLIGSLSSVPNGVLRRDFKFKEIGIANMVGAIVSCLSQVVMAANGFGVYTLVLGVIIFRGTKTVLVIIQCKWIPFLHFSFKDVKPYYKFGLGLAGGAALFRLYETLNTFIVGKMFNATQLGHYGFAFSLSNLPMEKVVPIFQQVTFPLLSRLQHDVIDRNKTFLVNMKMCFYFVGPLCFGGTLVGKEIVIGFLGEKWAAIVPMFRVFCIVAFLEFLTNFCNILFNSAGNSKAPLKLNVLRLILIPVSIFIAALYGFQYVIVPWTTVCPLLLIGWTVYTLKVFNIKIVDYLCSMKKPFFFSTVFAVSCLIIKHILAFSAPWITNYRIIVVILLTFGTGVSALYLYLFDRDAIKALRRIKDKNKEKNT